MIGAIENQELAASNVLCPNQEIDKEMERENQFSKTFPVWISAFECDMCVLIRKLLYNYSSCSEKLVKRWNDIPLKTIKFSCSVARRPYQLKMGGSIFFMAADF